MPLGPHTDRAVARLITWIPTALQAVFYFAIMATLIYIANRNDIARRRARRQEALQQQPPSPLSPSPLPPAPLFRASAHHTDHKIHLLLAATGSVATIKIPQILTLLSTHHSPTTLSIRLLLSPSAAKFLNGQSPEQPSLAQLSQIPCLDGIYVNEDEWHHPWTRGAPILHIELRRWADLMVIAPLSANSLAKIALGLSGDLISSVVRAWDTTGLIDPPRSGTLSFPSGGARKRIILAPAMNTAMWNHPVTREYVEKLEGAWGVESGGWMEVLRPVEKDLACGDVGAGAMREWKEIVEIVEERLRLQGKIGEGAK